MKISLTTYGSLSERLASGSMELPDACDLISLQLILLNRHPVLGETPFRIAVNDRFVPAETTLQPGDAVALLPPFSGG